jgi:aminoglycoside phosphotransferase
LVVDFADFGVADAHFDRTASCISVATQNAI